MTTRPPFFDDPALQRLWEALHAAVAHSHVPPVEAARVAALHAVGLLLCAEGPREVAETMEIVSRSLSAKADLDDRQPRH